MKLTLVVAEFGVAMVAAVGPPTCTHRKNNGTPAGRPSSIAPPESTAVPGRRAITLSSPALTTGGWLPGAERTVTSSLVESSPSEAVSRSTYVPRALRVTDVRALLGWSNAAVPGPLTTVHAALRVFPSGSPSSPTLPDRKTVFAGRLTVRSG